MKVAGKEARREGAMHLAFENQYRLSVVEFEAESRMEASLFR